MANNIDIKDAAAATTAIKTTESGGVHTPHHNVDSCALPTGAATQATLAALDAKVTACNTGAVVLAAGSAAIGKLAANSGVDIGDVDVASLPALAAGSNLIGKVSIDQVTANANEVVTKTGSVTAATLQSGSAIVGQVGIDQTTDGTTNKVQARNATHGDFQANVTLQINDADVAAGVPVPVQSPAFVSSDSQTRPDNTTAYAALDVVGQDPADNLSFAGIGNIAAGCVYITGATLRCDVSAVPSGMSSFRLHLYDAAPTGIADNTAYNLPSGDRAKYLGYIELPTPVDLGDTLWSETQNVNKKIKLAAASTTIYGILQTVGAFTPSAQTVKTVTIMGVQC